MVHSMNRERKMNRMDDLISRQAAIDALGEEPLLWTEDDAGEVAERNQWKQDVAAIKALPSAERHGRWLVQDKGIIVTSYRCSECGRVVRDDTGYDVSIDYPYCHCGAKMDEVEE